MFDWFHWIVLTKLLGIAVIALPAILLALLGLSSLVGRPLPERVISGLVQATMVSGFLAAVGMLAAMLAQGTRHITIDLGHWVHIDGFHFSLKLLFDRLSIPFAILTYLLCGVIGGFANRYLHREPGFNRFFVFYAVFVLGMVLTSLAETIEVLFTGWELVGVSSAMLVAFFHERINPVQNGLRVWTVYRVSDAALLLAAVMMHHLRGHGDFDALLGAGPWPEGQALLTSQQALIVGLLLLVAASGKSALVPFSGWLPRAMEGPTPSSAVFYGALSVHLGAFLLLRVSPLLERSPLLCGMVVAVGLLTAAFAALAARVQSDIKCALSFASLTQVGIIVAEIGLGLRYIALIHILGHACMRTLQFLRAPSLLQDYHALENAIGGRLAAHYGLRPQFLSPRLQNWLYRFSLRRGYLDAWLADYIARPVLGVFRMCDALERRWTNFLSGGQSRESDLLGPGAGSLEDLA
jgi:NADH:ubiquinone oxidoreductase subunit 5 (subunit L)/multisubunit Na+/H+ antiporter MnhA subunit